MTRQTQAELLRHAMDAAGMSAYALNKAMGYRSKDTVGKMLRGELAITEPDTIAGLCAVLPLTADDIYAAGQRIPPDIKQAIIAEPEFFYRLIRETRRAGQQ